MQRLYLTSLCGCSPLKKVKAVPANAIAIIAPTRPIPAHRSQPFRKLKGSFQSEIFNMSRVNHIVSLSHKKLCNLLYFTRTCTASPCSLLSCIQRSGRNTFPTDGSLCGRHLRHLHSKT